MKCAVKALNLHYPKIYDLPDKGLQDYPLKEGAAIVLREEEYFTRKEHFSQVWPGLNGKKIFDDLYEQV